MRPEVRLIECKTILTRASGFLRGYTHTLNPYAGCALGAGGCGVYCYVAESPVGLFGRAPWGHWVDAKVNAADALRRELARAPTSTSFRIFMSSATDPYQPVEARLSITRSILAVLLDQPVRRLVVQTRSPLVERDFDLLARLPFAWLSLTLETDDDTVRRSLTPICPSIERRVQTMRRARGVGIPVQAAISPVLPHDPTRFASLLAACADRVVVDTFVSGDGSQGRRTSRRPLPTTYAELGYGDWRDETAAYKLHRVLGQQLSPDRVHWSAEGFNSL